MLLNRQVEDSSSDILLLAVGSARTLYQRRNRFLLHDVLSKSTVDQSWELARLNRPRENEGEFVPVAFEEIVLTSSFESSAQSGSFELALFTFTIWNRPGVISSSANSKQNGTAASITRDKKRSFVSGAATISEIHGTCC
jgi:hypothetical protein